MHCSNRVIWQNFILCSHPPANLDYRGLKTNYKYVPIYYLVSINDYSSARFSPITSNRTLLVPEGIEKRGLNVSYHTNTSGGHSTPSPDTRQNAFSKRGSIHSKSWLTSKSTPLGSFNNYVEKMRWVGGPKISISDHKKST